MIAIIILHVPCDSRYVQAVRRNLSTTLSLKPDLVSLDGTVFGRCQMGFSGSIRLTASPNADYIGKAHRFKGGAHFLFQFVFIVPGFGEGKGDHSSRPTCGRSNELPQ